MRNGYGEEEDSDGCKYNGVFKDNKKNGFGIEFMKKGTKVSVFEGQWVNDKKEGFAIMYSLDKPKRKKLAYWEDGERKFWINKRRKVKFQEGVDSINESKLKMEELKAQCKGKFHH